MTIRLLVAFILASFATQSSAAIAESSAGGFRIHHEISVDGKTGDQVWAGLTDIGHWWNKAHTYSGDSANLKLDTSPGGCFCERFGTSWVQHLVVVNVMPRGLLRLTGTLGPLQAMPVNGVMSWTFRKGENGAIVVLMDYAVSGNATGLQEMAGPVDGVLGDQMQRLERFIETGKADP